MVEVLERENTVEAVIATGTPVLRSGPQPDGSPGQWNERLDIGGANLNRAAGAALLVDHLARSDFQIGVVERVHAEPGKLVAALRFSKNDRAQEYKRDQRDRVRRQISIGYSVEQYRRDSDQRDKIPTYTATAWTLLEVSMVAIAADFGAQFRNSSSLSVRFRTMSEHSPTAAEGSSPPLFSLTDQKVVEAAENGRQSAIVDAVERFRMPAAMARQFIDEGLSLDAVRTHLIDARAAVSEATMVRNINPFDGGTGIPPGGGYGRVSGGVDHADPANIRSRMAGALAHSLSAGLCPLPEESREFRNFSFLDMGRDLAGARGVRLRSSAEVASWITRSGGLHTTSDFALVVADASNKTVMERFQRLLPALAICARRTSTINYHLIRRLRVGEGPELLEVGEHGEVRRGTTGEEGENYVLRRWARIFGLSRKLIVNDDQGAFADHLNGFADAAASKLGDVLAAVLLNNANMSDGVPLFHSTHGNTAAGAAISVTSLSAARMLMRAQKGVDGGPIQVVPKYLAVGSAKETEAEQVLTTLAAAETGQTNPFAGKLELVVEPRITGNKWFIFSEPTVSPVLEYAEMDGPHGGPGPSIEVREGFDVEGIEVKTAYDVGAAAIGWRGAFYSPGA